MFILLLYISKQDYCDGLCNVLLNHPLFKGIITTNQQCAHLNVDLRLCLFTFVIISVMLRGLFISLITTGLIKYFVPFPMLHFHPSSKD